MSANSKINQKPPAKGRLTPLKIRTAYFYFLPWAWSGRIQRNGCHFKTAGKYYLFMICTH